MNLRFATLALLGAFGLALSTGCSSADGGASIVGESETNGEDSGGEEETSDDTGEPSDTEAADTTAKDTAVADSAPIDTGTTDTAPIDTGPADGWPAAYAALEEQILVETNKRRAAGANCRTKGTFGPAGPLVMHPLLRSAARKHSKDMATNNYFSHDNLAGQTPFDRMKAEGYKGSWMGENIAAGNSTAAATVQQWMNSDGHCANIMNPKFTQLGVGYWYNASSKYRHYWTQNFGAGG